VTTADAEQSTVAAFRPWRGSKVRIPWALAKLKSAGKIKPKVGEGSKQNLAAGTTKKQETKNEETKNPTVMPCLDSSFELQELGGTESAAFDFQ
jgi:hypothetical protein